MQSENETVFPAVCGGGVCRTSAALLPANKTLELPAFPRNLKKGVSMTFSAKFDTFDTLFIGKGYQSYRGDWFEIDKTEIVSKRFETEPVTRTSVPHGLKFEKFLLLSFLVDNDSVCHLSLTTFSGTATFDFEWSFEQNGVPFVFGGQDMTEVTLSAVANDSHRPVWLFGDSYFGVYETRVIGQLKKLGYTDGCLIDGLAGQNSGGAYRDLEALLALGGVPRYLVWMLGMNDTVERFETHLQKVRALSEQYGFTLILQKVPIVPPRITENNAINEIVAMSGLRFIDACRAVGADANGVWYDGYLFTDNIHPTARSAAAIAARMLVDFPEIMQYGYRAEK